MTFFINYDKIIIGKVFIKSVQQRGGCLCRIRFCQNRNGPYWIVVARLQLFGGGAALSVGQSAFETPLTREQMKSKIVGHWGTVPGQNFIYTHLNRLIL